MSWAVYMRFISFEGVFLLEGLREAVYMRVPSSEGTPFVWF